MLYYLNNDLSILKVIDFKSTGLYFWAKRGNSIVATMRDGALLFFDFEDDSYDIVQLIDPSIRMWALLVDDNNIVCGSYDGDLLLLKEKELIYKTRIAQKRNSVWVIEKFGDRYFVGTANGTIYLYNKDLSQREFVIKHAHPISSATVWEEHLIFADYVSNIYVLHSDMSIKSFDFNIQSKTANTIWWIEPYVKQGLIKVGYSNGSLETFRITLEGYVIIGFEIQGRFF